MNEQPTIAAAATSAARYYCSDCGRIATSPLDWEQDGKFICCGRCGGKLEPDRRRYPKPIASTHVRRPHWWDPDGRARRREVVDQDQAEATLSALRRALRGCGGCDWDEAEGGLVDHCAACQRQITTIALGLFGE